MRSDNTYVVTPTPFSPCGAPMQIRLPTNYHKVDTIVVTEHDFMDCDVAVEVYRAKGALKPALLLFKDPSDDEYWNPEALSDIEQGKVITFKPIAQSKHLFRLPYRWVCSELAQLLRTCRSYKTERPLAYSLTAQGEISPLGAAQTFSLSMAESGSLRSTLVKQGWVVRDARIDVVDFSAKAAAIVQTVNDIGERIQHLRKKWCMPDSVIPNTEVLEAVKDDFQREAENISQAQQHRIDLLQVYDSFQLEVGRERDRPIVEDALLRMTEAFAVADKINISAYCSEAHNIFLHQSGATPVKARTQFLLPLADELRTLAAAYPVLSRLQAVEDAGKDVLRVPLGNGAVLLLSDTTVKLEATTQQVHGLLGDGLVAPVQESRGSGRLSKIRIRKVGANTGEG